MYFEVTIPEAMVVGTPPPRCVELPVRYRFFTARDLDLGLNIASEVTSLKRPYMPP